MEYDLNVFGEKLINCSTNPMTGFYRDGCCHTGPEDHGTHTVCCIVSLEFLRFSKAMGNDLSTPVPQFNFPGLKPGDQWCLCAMRWEEAHRNGLAPKVILEATNEKTLDYVSMEDLLEHAYKTAE